MLRWSFEPILESYRLVLLLSGMLVLLLLWIRPWRRPTVTRRQWILMSLRAGAIFLLTVAMLRPAHIRTESRPQSATLVVLCDLSRSMNVQDSSGGRSRWQQLSSTLIDSRDEWQRLGELFDVRAYGFAESLTDDMFSDGKLQLPVKPMGDETDIARAISEALRRESGKRLAGVILLSDGSQRVLQPRFNLQQAVRELTRMNAPLYSVTFGKPRDESRARDVLIERLQDQYTVFVNNELSIRGAVRVKGYINQPVPVRVMIEGPDGVTSQTLGPQDVSAMQDDELVDFSFEYSPTVAGAYKLTVEAVPQDGELVVTNNRLTAYLNVLEGGLRVLYLEGNLLGAEQQVLRRSLATSPDIELDFQPIDPRRRDEWPIDLSATLRQTSYDVFLIGDVDATALGKASLHRIADQVQRGKGLMMTGGLNTFGPGGYENTPLADVLPVNLLQVERQRFGPDEPIRSDVHITGPLQMLPTRPHFITHLANGSENLKAWRRLRPLLGANRFESLKSGEQAIRLAETEAGDPLLLARQYGAGRVLVFAADSTHLWWRYGQQDAHRRFWRQAMLWLANKDELLRRDIWVRLPRRRFRPGEAVTFTAGARGETGDVIENVELTATLQLGQEASQPIRLVRDRDGQDWSAELEPIETAGEYSVLITARLDGEEIGQATARFTVQALDLELADPAANPQQLAILSQLTSTAGGRAVPPEQVRDLLAEILQKPPEMEIEVESKWRFGDSATETWPFFLAFVAILTGEWFLRKKWGLN